MTWSLSPHLDSLVTASGEYLAKENSFYIQIAALPEACKYDLTLAGLLEKDHTITPAEMLHNLHLAGYAREESVLLVKKLFSDLPADELCRIIVNEYTKPLIEKGEL